MKFFKVLFAAVYCSLFIAGCAAHYTHEPTEYENQGVITFVAPESANENVSSLDCVTVRDDQGESWDFLADRGSFNENERVKLIMNDNGTLNNIYDDQVINAYRI